MKTTLRIIIISLTLFISVHSFSQSLIEEGMNWSIYEGHYPPWGTYYETKLFKIEGDTIINSFQYKIIKSTSYSNWTHLQYNGAIRVDSTKKVYYNNYMNEDFLIYDFNLAPTDTFFGNSIWDGQIYTLVVESVDSVYLETGVKKKRITFTANPSGYPTEYWIEDVGSNFGLMFTGFYMYMYDVDYELLCCSSQNDLLFINENYFTCYISATGIDNPEENNICIFPNPTGEKINVKGTYIKSIELTNLNGQVILKRNINNNNVSVNISNEPKGMYFMKVLSDKGLSVKKIIKQ